MNPNNEEIRIDKTAARAGSTPGVTRYVLGFGLVLVVIAFVVIVMTGVMNTDHDNSAQENSQRAVAEQKAQPEPN